MRFPLRWDYARVVAHTLGRSRHTLIRPTLAEQAGAAAAAQVRPDANLHLPPLDHARPRILAALAETLGRFPIEDASIGQRILLDDLTDEVYSALSSHAYARRTRREYLARTPPLLRRI